MAARLKIIWDGNVPGLSEHRLSLSAFGEPLTCLLTALRRIASNIVTDALGSAEHSATGRLANAAKQLDIEIAKLEEGSAGISAICTFQNSPSLDPTVFGDLPDRAAIELLEAIEQESQGRPKHFSVRKYLNSLPSGVRRQEYYVENEDGHLLREPVRVSQMALPEVPQEMPFLSSFVGSIIGVGFEPGKTDVQIKTKTGQVSLAATVEQVESALELRASAIKALAVMTKPPRLLRLEKTDAAAFTVDDDQVERHIFQRWNVLLQRLAQ